jgi:hypothetical protein
MPYNSALRMRKAHTPRARCSVRLTVSTRSRPAEPELALDGALPWPRPEYSFNGNAAAPILEVGIYSLYIYMFYKYNNTPFR